MVMTNTYTDKHTNSLHQNVGHKTHLYYPWNAAYKLIMFGFILLI